MKYKDFLILPPTVSPLKYHSQNKPYIYASQLSSSSAGAEVSTAAALAVVLLAIVTVARVVGRAGKEVVWSAALEIAIAATELTEEEDGAAAIEDEAATVDAATLDAAIEGEAAGAESPEPPTVKSTQDS